MTFLRISQILKNSSNFISKKNFLSERDRRAIIISNQILDLKNKEQSNKNKKKLKKISN